MYKRTDHDKASSRITSEESPLMTIALFNLVRHLEFFHIQTRISCIFILNKPAARNCT